MDGATILGTVPLDSEGRATLTTSSLAKGSHKVRADHSGDSHFNPSQAKPVVQVVQ